ncbi:AMEP412 family response elicitor [Clostridium sp. BL-8]|uniref:AMEP412 family response elicitor n=1 Tax=Clostridium sp. BL-8 TaxID=349938 RepID=UPI00098C67A0|nr:AMEP412 family response elicitor [Clostridium sp. BL-8]OOM69020.1 hypothetical protein CLOBL_52870 [Clostridium sp. BL-8]
MLEELLDVLEDLASKIPTDKISAFFSWCSSFVSTVALYAYYYGGQIINWVKDHGADVANMFLKGWSAYKAVQEILKHFGINI